MIQSYTKPDRNINLTIFLTANLETFNNKILFTAQRHVLKEKNILIKIVNQLYSVCMQIVDNRNAKQDRFKYV